VIAAADDDGIRMVPRAARTRPNRPPGLLSFHADDTAEIIRIFDVTWIGRAGTWTMSCCSCRVVPRLYADTAVRR
jgi:hypothetical protein